MTRRRWKTQPDLWRATHLIKIILHFVIDQYHGGNHLLSPGPPHKPAGQGTPSTLPPTHRTPTKPEFPPRPVDKALPKVGHALHPDPPHHPAQEEPMTDQPICPVCQQPATDVAERTKRGITIAECICPNEHLWSTRWLLPTIPLDPLPDQEAS